MKYSSVDVEQGDMRMRGLRLNSKKRRKTLAAALVLSLMVFASPASAQTSVDDAPTGTSYTSYGRSWS